MITEEARQECEGDETCLRLARTLCRRFCNDFPDAEKCQTHCCPYVCNYRGHCRRECRPDLTSPPQPYDEDETLRIRYRREIPLLVQKNTRSWKFNAMPIHNYQYGSITGTTIDSVWAQGDSMAVVNIE